MLNSFDLKSKALNKISELTTNKHSSDCVCECQWLSADLYRVQHLHTYVKSHLTRGKLKYISFIVCVRQSFGQEEEATVAKEHKRMHTSTV